MNFDFGGLLLPWKQSSHFKIISEIMFSVSAIKLEYFEVHLSESHNTYN